MEQVERIDDYQAVVVGSGVREPLAEAGNGLPEEIPDAEGSVEAAAASASAPSASRASESGWIGSAPVAT